MKNIIPTDTGFCSCCGARIGPQGWICLACEELWITWQVEHGPGNTAHYCDFVADYCDAHEIPLPDWHPRTPPLVFRKAAAPARPTRSAEFWRRYANDEM